MKIGGARDLSGALRSTGSFLTRHLWVWPMVAALALGGAGWWVHDAMEKAIRRQMADGLTTILHADVKAIRTWMKDQEANAQILAGHETTLPLIRDLIRVEGTSKKINVALRTSQAQEKLREHFRPRLPILKYADFFLVSLSNRVLAASQDEAVGRSLTGYRKDFFADVLKGKPLVSLPYRSILVLPDEDEKLKGGLPTMLAAAPIFDEKGRIIAALGLRIRPERDFTQILQIARSGETGETYAFDRRGLLLSGSFHK